MVILSGNICVAPLIAGAAPYTKFVVVIAALRSYGDCCEYDNKK